MNELLECRRLCSGLLRDATFDLRQGQIAAILGAADSGTDVLRRILEGSEKKYTGYVRFRGRDVRLCSVAQVQNLGIFSIGHEGILLPNMTVYENIGILNGLDRKGLFLRKKWSRQQAGYLLERFDIQASLDALPGELTAYQCHEVEILKAISSGASLLIFSGFFEEYSQEARSRFAQRLRYLTSLGISVLVLLEKPYIEWKTLFDNITFLERGVSGITLEGRECIGAMERWAFLHSAPGENISLRARHTKDGALATIIDVRTKEQMLTVSKGEVVGVLDTDRLFPRRADEAGVWLERNIRICIQEKIYSLKALKKQGKRIEIVCNHFGASPVLENWSIAENVSFTACQVYSRSGILNRRVARHIARRTLESADFFAPLLKHWNDENCCALDDSSRKRIETARAFASRPDVIIFAHAASQLSAKETEELHTLIQDRAKKRDCAYIVIESDEYELTQLGADQLYRLT